ncbi:MAG: NifB/NifX family molybdenum-iron cluster-binding protein [Geobacteraceae bacterium]|nr:NifB/NifX family molybdenum-iron cluster-binding protein [Geobacteraceae bacterium]
MKVCFPVVKDAGLQSPMYGHFTSAPFFLEVDTDTGESSTIANCDTSAPERGCNPYKALANRQLDGVIVVGVGDGGLDMLNMMGYRVFEAQTMSIKENIDLFLKQELPEARKMNSAEAGRCGDASEASGCGHSHGDEGHDH